MSHNHGVHRVRRRRRRRQRIKIVVVTTVLSAVALVGFKACADSLSSELSNGVPSEDIMKMLRQLPGGAP